MNQTHMNIYKLLVIGEERSGKTTFIERLTTGHFLFNYTPTPGVTTRLIRHYNLINKDIITEENRLTNMNKTRFDTWDLSGREEYEGQSLDYYTGADACLLFVDISRDRPSSVLRHEVESRISGVRVVCGDIPIILVGNKINLNRTQIRGVRLYQATQELDYQKYYTTSGKSITNMNTILDALVGLLEV